MKQENLNIETGRSMVEMLGVLAIVGILSVVGVASYSTAMTKHKANELLNEAKKRAIVVSGHILQNNTGNVPLTEFGSDPVYGATFGPNATVENKQIKLTLSNVDEKVCAQMKASLGDNAAMAIAEECGTSPLTLTFNEDLSRGVTASPSDSEDGMWEPQECEDDNDCGECEVCLGECYKVQSETCQCGENDMLVPGPEEGMTVCIPCNFNNSDIPSEFCSQCSNRTMMTDGDYEYCGFTSCPSNYWLDEEYGECVTCNGSWPIPIDEFPNNIETACSNRTTITEDGERVSILSGCTSGYTFDEEEEICMKNCPAGQIDDGDGNCVTDCSDYPGTFVYNNGGAVSAKPGCKCPSDATWDSTSNICICKKGYVKNESGECDLDKCYEVECNVAQECVDGNCSFMSCNSYQDCNSGAYCNSRICEVINEPEPVYIEGIGNTWKGPLVSWEVANDWCLAIGKNLITVEDLDCVYNDDTPITSESFSDSNNSLKWCKSCSSTIQALKTEYKTGWTSSTSYEVSYGGDTIANKWRFQANKDGVVDASPTSSAYAICK